MLIEGPPGVGKTSLVTAIAGASGHHLTRINLSEHTVSHINLTTLLQSEISQHETFSDFITTTYTLATVCAHISSVTECTDST